MFQFARAIAPDYTADVPLQPSQGVFVLSTRSGTWRPSGAAYSAGQPVSLLRGWNLVGAPFPSGGLDGSAINSQIGSGCGLQEVATYSNGAYQAHTPTATYHVPATAGMWMLCTKSHSWSPS